MGRFSNLSSRLLTLLTMAILSSIIILTQYSFDLVANKTPSAVDGAESFASAEAKPPVTTVDGAMHFAAGGAKLPSTVDAANSLASAETERPLAAVGAERFAAAEFRSRFLLQVVNVRGPVPPSKASDCSNHSTRRPPGKCPPTPPDHK